MYYQPRLSHAFSTLVSLVVWHHMTWRAISARPYMTAAAPVGSATAANAGARAMGVPGCLPAGRAWLGLADVARHATGTHGEPSFSS